jgi:hypothetical protein
MVKKALHFIRFVWFDIRFWAPFSIGTMSGFHEMKLQMFSLFPVALLGCPLPAGSAFFCSIVLFHPFLQGMDIAWTKDKNNKG